jgi:hypothetical protein
LILLLPPFVWDSLTYHLTNVAHWTQVGRIELFTTSVNRIYNPANFEVLTSWFTLFLHHDVVIEAAGLPVYVLGLAAVYAIGRRLDLSPSSSLMAALAYGSTPAVLLATTGTKNDPHVAAYYLSALAIVLHLARRERDEQHNSAFNIIGLWLSLTLIILLAIGTKTYILHLTPGLALIGLIAGWRAGGLKVWARSLGDAFAHFRSHRRAIRFLIVLLILAGLMLGGYWNVRNWILKGNPFYPYGVALERQEIISGEKATLPLSFSRMIRNLESLVFKFGDKQARITPDLTDTTGWGWFVYSLGIPALLWAILRKPRMRMIALGFILSLLLLFLSDRPSPWNMRYTIWFSALFGIAYAALQDSMMRSAGIARPIMHTLFTLCLALNVLMMLNYGKVSVERFEVMLHRPILHRESASLKLNIPSEYENAIDFVPKDEILGYNLHGNGFIYPLYRSDFSQKLVYVPLSSNDTCEQVAQKMRDHGTRWLFVAPEHSPDPNIALLRMCSDSDTTIRERARGLYVTE